MNAAFYLSAVIAVLATAMVIIVLNPVHALLYLIVSLLAVALVFFTLGAPFAAALEIIIYAGAVIVLFVFVVMMLNLGKDSALQERQWLWPRVWIGPVALAVILLAELIYLQGVSVGVGNQIVEAKQVGIVLYGPYLLGVELASMLLLAGLVGAYHLGQREEPKPEGKAGAAPLDSLSPPGGEGFLRGDVKQL
jgi:NADH-quinone oxidoreductase subunit J